MDIHLSAIAKLNNTVQQLKQEDNPNKRMLIRQYMLGMLDALSICGAITSLEREEYLLIVSDSIEQDY